MKKITTLSFILFSLIILAQNKIETNRFYKKGYNAVGNIAIESKSSLEEKLMKSDINRSLANEMDSLFLINDSAYYACKITIKKPEISLKNDKLTAYLSYEIKYFSSDSLMRKENLKQFSTNELLKELLERDEKLYNSNPDAKLKLDFDKQKFQQIFDEEMRKLSEEENNSTSKNKVKRKKSKKDKSENKK
jgi:hypothetical protein